MPDDSPAPRYRKKPPPEAEPVRRLVVNSVEAATMLNVSRWTIYTLTARGELPSFTIGRSRKIRVSDIEAFLRAREQEG